MKENDVKKVIGAVIASVNMSKAKLKDVRALVAKKLECSEGELKKLTNFKSMVIEALQPAEDGSEEDSVVHKRKAEAFDSEESSVSGHEDKKRLKVAKSPSNKSGGIGMIRKFITAAAIGPAIYKDLPEGKKEQEEELMLRLKRKGFKFSGKLPNSRDISKVKKKVEMERELDGIDTSNVISDSRGSRSTRTSRNRVAAPRQHLSDDDEDEHDESNESESESEIQKEVPTSVERLMTNTHDTTAATSNNPSPDQAKAVEISKESEPRGEEDLSSS